MRNYLVRFGVLGSMGQFRSSDGIHLGRGIRIICRTPRGLEVGVILADVSKEVAVEINFASATDRVDGTILRRMTPEDELLWGRIERDRLRALDDCQQLLESQQISAVLMDAELLFDGKSLFFYFLGDPPTDVDAVTSKLALVYEARVQLQPFADAVLSGCGPDCGTESAKGCGEECSTCAVLQACKK